jgi:hypothetical protein
VKGKLLAAALGAAVATLALVPTSLGETLAQTLLGPGLVRAEVVVQRDGAFRVYRVDRGRVLTKTRAALTLREQDGTIVSVPLSAATRYELGGRTVRFRAVRVGMTATTTRVGDGAAERVQLRR